MRTFWTWMCALLVGLTVAAPSYAMSAPDASPEAPSAVHARASDGCSHVDGTTDDAWEMSRVHIVEMQTEPVDPDNLILIPCGLLDSGRAGALCGDAEAFMLSAGGTVLCQIEASPAYYTAPSTELTDGPRQDGTSSTFGHAVAAVVTHIGGLAPPLVRTISRTYTLAHHRGLLIHGDLVVPS